MVVRLGKPQLLTGEAGVLPSRPAVDGDGKKANNTDRHPVSNSRETDIQKL